MRQGSRFLYLNSWRGEDRDLRLFIPEICDSLTVICPRGREDYFKAAGIDALGVSAFAADQILREIKDRRPHERTSGVLADAEDHMECAAELRARLGLPGQTLESARAFRDKAVMKQILENTSAHFRLPGSLTQRAHRYVIKPARGTDSQDVLIVNQTDAVSFAGREDVVVEEFIDYPVYHVDGILKDGSIAFYSVTQYQGTCLNYRGGAAVGGFICLDARLRDRFKIAVDAVLRRMPTADLMLFHAEFFYDLASDDMVFCEVAGRSGGGCGIIVQSIQDTYGVNLTREYLLGSTQRDYTVRGARPRTDGLVASYAMIPRPRGGKINERYLAQLRVTHFIPGNEAAGDYSSLDGVKLVFLTPPAARTETLRALCENLFLWE